MWLDYTDKLVKISAVIVGGIWAYVKFIRGRVFHTRLEPAVSGRILREGKAEYVLARVKLKNVGASKVDIQQAGTALRVWACNLLEGASGITWTRTHTLTIFERHGWIEAGECIEDTLFVSLPANVVVVKLDLRIVSKKIEWNATTVIDSDDVDQSVQPQKGHT